MFIPRAFLTLSLNLSFHEGPAGFINTPYFHYSKDDFQAQMFLPLNVIPRSADYEDFRGGAKHPKPPGHSASREKAAEMDFIDFELKT